MAAHKNMTYELIISEKPSSALKIAQALADGKPVKKANSGVAYYELAHNKKDIIVAAAAGHLFGVGETGDKRTYTYPVFTMEWKPNSEIDKGAAFSKKYITTLKKLAKNASSFTVATDYDIEGETIGYNIIRFIAKQKDANRMKFSTLTKEDLVESYQNKQDHIDWGQANAGETRHFLDWLYGINLSRALTQSVKAAGSFKVLSIGRVQGPALKMIVEKEREISAFVPEDYWQIEMEGDVNAWHKADKFWKEDEAKSVHEKVKDEKQAKVENVDSRTQKQAAPSPFDLGTLQTEAYRLFKIRPKETLDIAQKLYSSTFISYPRTSSQKLDPKIGFEKILAALAKQEQYTTNAQMLIKRGKLKPNNGKKDDPAHPAIYPTGTNPGELVGRDQKVYDLVVKRFMATFGEPATRETMTVTLDVNNEPFVAKGTRTVDQGWYTLYAPYVKLQEEELPKVKAGDIVNAKKFELHQKQTQPPKRYTQSSIITELEKRSLGTKATRADVVEALFKRDYATGDNSIEATKLGMHTLEILEKHSPEIVDAALTREFEEDMEEIRQGKKNGEQILTAAKIPLEKILNKYKKDEKEVGKDLIVAYREGQDELNTLGKCPKCKEGNLRIMFAKKTKKRFLGCGAYPECENTYPLPQKGKITSTDKVCESCQNPIVKIGTGKRTQQTCINVDCPSKKEANVVAEEKECPKCKKPLVLRKSVYGQFYGCSGYPKCKHTEKIKEK